MWYTVYWFRWFYSMYSLKLVIFVKSTLSNKNANVWINAFNFLKWYNFNIVISRSRYKVLYSNIWTFMLFMHFVWIFSNAKIFSSLVISVNLLLCSMMYLTSSQAPKCKNSVCVFIFLFTTKSWVNTNYLQQNKC